METRLLVGIAGASGSGKSTAADRLEKHFSKNNVLIFRCDHYYNAIGSADTNFDHPDSIDWELFYSHLDALMRGETIHQPEYDFNTHRRTTNTTPVLPKKIIILEGILVLQQERLRNMYHLQIFIDAAADLYALRRIGRDILSKNEGGRGRSFGQAYEQYTTTVKPMTEQFILPCKAHASIVIENNHKLADMDIQPAIDAIKAAKKKLRLDANSHIANHSMFANTNTTPSTVKPAAASSFSLK
jgi:uridine kinase